MNMITIISFFIAVFFSLSVTWFVRSFALRKSILDIPNERSSHSIPTPRGGGSAIVVTFLSSILMLKLTGMISSSLTWTLTGGGLLIAIIGYCDDVYTIKARWRFFIHFLAAVWAIFWLGGFTSPALSYPWLTNSITIIGIAWCINFYNFMDGIDGLAGGEGIFICLASGSALLLAGADHSALVMWLLAASILGFTIWNWPPAKIFMGDIGSGFLGYIFATFALYTVNQHDLSVSFWWILAAIFICDSTFTLIYRIYQRKRWYSAHREHAYQHLIAYGIQHKFVTAGIVLFNLCVLLPLAYATLRWTDQAIWFACAATAGLWLMWYGIKGLPIVNNE